MLQILKLTYINIYQTKLVKVNNNIIKKTILLLKVPNEILFAKYKAVVKLGFLKGKLIIL